MQHSGYTAGNNTTTHEFEVAEVIALVLLLNAILAKGMKYTCCNNTHTVATLDRAKGVFMIPALHISTSIAGWSYAAANDATDARSCHTVRKSTVLQFNLKVERGSCSLQQLTLRSMTPKETLAAAAEDAKSTRLIPMAASKAARRDCLPRLCATYL